jgi:hypothetical protein
MVVAMVAVFVALGGTSYGVISSSSVPDSLGVFHACVNGSSGGIRIVTAASSCRKAVTRGKHKTPAELAVAWSQTGPAGKNGSNGTNGINGKDGTNGINGTNGATSVTAREGSLVVVGNGKTGIASASCNPGEKATGGGSAISGSDSGWMVNEAFPTPSSGTPTGWQVRATNVTGSSNNLVAFVICVSP